MKKILAIALVAAVLALMVYFWSLISVFLVSSEKIGVPELSAMARCKINPLKKIEIDIDGKKYSVPLPYDSAFYKSKNNLDGKRIDYYLTSSKDWSIYFNEILSKYGWENVKELQMGSGHTIKRKDSGVKVDFVVQSFTRNYEIMSFVKE